MTLNRFKDCNECLKAGLSGAVMMACLSSAFDFAPEKVQAAEEFREAFLQEWFEHVGEKGLQLPWEFPFRIRRGELTVWTGIEKSGKSTVLGFAIVCLMAQGERALLASFEVPPVKSLKKLSQQVYGGLLYDPDQVEYITRKADLSDAEREEALADYRMECRKNANEAFDYLANSLWIYNHVGIGQWRELLEDIRWARRRHGITQFVVDNFMRLGIVKDDYAQQADAITAFAAAAIELDCHIHMVVHQNKSEGRRGGDSGKRTVSGAFEIIANAHNIVEVQRDVRKGEKVADLYEKKKISAISEEDFKKERATLDLVADGKFILHAAREGEIQNGSKYLWFLYKAQQYADHPPGHFAHHPISFLKRDKQTELPVSTDLPTTPTPTNERTNETTDGP
jgi:twinkle protein